MPRTGWERDTWYDNEEREELFKRLPPAGLIPCFNQNAQGSPIEWNFPSRAWSWGRKKKHRFDTPSNAKVDIKIIQTVEGEASIRSALKLTEAATTSTESAEKATLARVAAEAARTTVAEAKPTKEAAYLRGAVVADHTVTQDFLTAYSHADADCSGAMDAVVNRLEKRAGASPWETSWRQSYCSGLSALLAPSVGRGNQRRHMGDTPFTSGCEPVGVGVHPQVLDQETLAGGIQNPRSTG